MFAVPKGTKGVTIEGKVREKLAPTQKMPMDFTGGLAVWTKRGNVAKVAAANAPGLDWANLAATCSVLANSAAPGAHIAIDLTRDDIDWNNVAPGGTNYVYILEALAAKNSRTPPPMSFKILKVGEISPGDTTNGNSPEARAEATTSNALSYISMAREQYPLVLHLFRVDQLPEAYRNKKLVQVEADLRKQLYAQNFWMPEDREVDRTKPSTEDLVKDVMN